MELEVVDNTNNPQISPQCSSDDTTTSISSTITIQTNHIKSSSTSSHQDLSLIKEGSHFSNQRRIVKGRRLVSLPSNTLNDEYRFFPEHTNHHYQQHYHHEQQNSQQGTQNLSRTNRAVRRVQIVSKRAALASKRKVSTIPYKHNIFLNHNMNISVISKCTRNIFFHKTKPTLKNRFGIVTMQVSMQHNQLLTNGKHPIKPSVPSSSTFPNQPNKYTIQQNQHLKKLKMDY